MPAEYARVSSVRAAAAFSVGLLLGATWSSPAATQSGTFLEKSTADLVSSVDAAEADLRARLVDLRKAEENGADDVGKRSLAVIKAEAIYRAVYSWSLQQQALRAADRVAFAEAHYDKAKDSVRLADATSAKRLNDYIQKTPGFLARATGLGASGLDVAVKARIETQLRILRTRESAAHEILVAISPVICVDQHLFSPSEVENLYLGRCTSRTVYRLASLARRLAASFPDSYLRNSVERDADLGSDVVKEMARIRNRLDMEEFRRVALSGLIVDPETGVPVSGVLRIRIAENAERSLVQYLDRTGKQGPYTKMWSGEPLRDIGKSFLAEITKRPDYKMLRYIEVGEAPSPEEFFLVAARVVRAEQEALLQAYNDGYLGGSFDQVDLEQLLRVSNAMGTGENSIESVNRRLKTFIADMDEAHNALMNARRMRPSELAQQSPKHFRLLEEMGFVEDSDDDLSNARYVIPETQSSFRAFAERARGGAALPGKGMLSVLNLRNTFQAAVSVAVPELAAARVAAMSRNILASERGMAAARLATEAAAGTLLDAAMEIGFQLKDARPGESIKGVEWDRLILESVVLGSALQFTGGAVDATFTSTLKALGSETPKSALYHLIKKRPLAASHIEAYARTTLGLASETGLTTFYQMYVQGHMDETSWTTVIMTSALSRAVATGIEHARSPRATWEQIKQYVPEVLRRDFDADPRLRDEVLANINRQLERDRKILDRFKTSMRGKDVTGKHLFSDLARGNLNWRDLTKAIYPKLSKEIRPAMEKLRQMREVYFSLMEREAQRRAFKDINRHFDALIAKANEETGDRTSVLEKIKLLEAQRSRELALLREKIIRPGSDDPTSDIDRSSRSNWVRRHLRALYESRTAYKTDGDVPTSARAFDVNEYINVFPFITESAKYLGRMRGKRSDGPAGLSQGRAMEALSLAAAMRHMGPRERELFLRNRRQIIKQKVKNRELPESEIRRFDEQVEYATASLSESEKAFAESRRQVAQMFPGRSESEIDVLASDALYDRRMEEINGLQFRLDQMERQDTDEALVLRARIQRLMAVALRDGIETYSSPTGLDIVVNRVQQEKTRGEDGEERKMKVADRMKDPRFTLDKELSGYSEREVASIVNDQIMFIAEHVHAFNSGHESFYETGRALGKYLERAFLGLKIAGLDIASVRKRSKADPHRRLLEAAEALVEKKGDPEGLQGVLTHLARSLPRTPEAGMAELFWLIEKVLPGMEGMTGVLAREEPKAARASAGSPAVDPLYRRIRMVLQRRWDRERALVRETGGPEMTVALVEAELAMAEAEIGQIEDRLNEMRSVGRDYLLRDWKQAIRLQNAALEYRVMAANLVDPLDPLLAEFAGGQKETERKLETLKAQPPRSKEDLDQRLYQEVKEYRRLKDRVAYLRDRQQSLQRDLKDEQARSQKAAALMKVDVTGRWVCTAKGVSDVSLEVRRNGNLITMELHLPSLETGRLSISARQLWGEIVGTWHQNPADGTAPAGLISAFPTADGTELQFTDRSTNDPELALDWSTVVCQREGAKAEARDLEAGYITISRTKANAGRASEGYWDLHTVMPSALSPRDGGPGARSMSSLGFAPSVRGVELQIRRGRRLYRDHALSAGDYLAVVTVGGQVATRPLKIVAGETTTVTVRPAALKVESGSGRVAGWFAAKLHNAGERGSGLMRLLGVDWYLVPPGAYDLELTTPVGSVWVKGIMIAAGEALHVRNKMADVKVEQGDLQKNPRIRRLSAAGSGGHTWWGFGADGKLGPLPPGKYEVMWTENGRNRHREIVLDAGAAVTVTLN